MNEQSPDKEDHSGNAHGASPAFDDAYALAQQMYDAKKPDEGKE